jgi:hypothetical protein
MHFRHEYNLFPFKYAMFKTILQQQALNTRMVREVHYIYKKIVHLFVSWHFHIILYSFANLLFLAVTSNCCKCVLVAGVTTGD